VSDDELSESSVTRRLRSCDHWRRAIDSPHRSVKLSRNRQTDGIRGVCGQSIAHRLRCCVRSPAFRERPALDSYSYSYSYSYSGAAGTRTRNRTVCSRIEYEYEYHFIEYEYDSRRLLKLDALFRRHPLENNEIAAYPFPQSRQRQNDPTLILTTMFSIVRKINVG